MNLLFPSIQNNIKIVREDLKEDFELAKYKGSKIFFFDFEKFIIDCEEIILYTDYKPKKVSEDLPTLFCIGVDLTEVQLQILQDFFFEKFKIEIKKHYE